MKKIGSYIPKNQKGSIDGVASLDGTGKVPASQLPSYVDDIIEVADFASLPVTGETGKIYITIDNNKIYRWSGSVYVEVSPSSQVYNVCAIYDANGVPTYYSDIQSAITAASAGQTVEILADVTETGAVEITLKDGVTINGNGHTYTLDNVTALTNAFTISSAADFTINNLTIVRTNGTGYCLYLNNALVNVILNGVTLKSASGAGVYGNCTSVTGNWKVLITANDFSIYGIAANVRFSGFDVYATGTVEAIKGSGFLSNGVVISTSSDCIQGAFDCSNVYSKSSGRYAFYSTGGTSLVKNCTLESSANNAVRGIGQYQNCLIKSTSSPCNYGVADEIFDDCIIWSTASYGAALGTRMEFNNCTIRSDASYVIYSNKTGIVNNSTIICNYNNSAGDGVNAQGNGGIFLNCTFDLANSSAYALDSISATVYTLDFAGCKVKGGTAIKSANINQGITNTEDSQGNILI